MLVRFVRQARRRDNSERSYLMMRRSQVMPPAFVKHESDMTCEDDLNQ